LLPGGLKDRSFAFRETPLDVNVNIRSSHARIDDSLATLVKLHHARIESLEGLRTIIPSLSSIIERCWLCVVPASQLDWNNLRAIVKRTRQGWRNKYKLSSSWSAKQEERLNRNIWAPTSYDIRPWIFKHHKRDTFQPLRSADLKVTISHAAYTHAPRTHARTHARPVWSRSFEKDKRQRRDSRVL